MNFDRDSLLLYAVTDRAWLKGQTLAQQVEQALLGGATMVQLREKQLDLPHFRREALEIQALCRRYGVPFLINDNVDLALDIGADGVHVGQEDMEAGLVRQKLGPGKILGVSAHSPEEALRAQAAGADYLGAGAVFHTGTKSNVSTLSYDTLRDICAAVKIPWWPSAASARAISSSSRAPASPEPPWSPPSSASPTFKPPRSICASWRRKLGVRK